MYEYILDGDMDYEDWACDSIFSHELISEKEFENLINEAQDKYIEKCGQRGDWRYVANYIVENDKRFFFPKKGRYAVIKYDKENKLMGVQ